LGGTIKDLDTKIDHAEKTLKHLRNLKEQINAKTTERSTLFKEQQDKHAALDEEYEGV
jgi:septal ring factor EnvC (AmiA/AmiB activator)